MGDELGPTVAKGTNRPNGRAGTQLPADEKQLEQAELQFNREVSGRHYLTRDQLMRSVQLGKTYRTFGYAGVHEVHQAEDLIWTFRISSGVSQGIDKSVVQSDWEFLRIGVDGSTLYKN